jgi:enoyl-CoA hydratase/carnithine racemase
MSMNQAGLQELVGTFETADALRVVVFESADPNFFVNHYDVSRAAETPVAPGPTGVPDRRLSDHQCLRRRAWRKTSRARLRPVLGALQWPKIAQPEAWIAEVARCTAWITSS